MADKIMKVENLYEKIFTSKFTVNVTKCHFMLRKKSIS